MIISAGAVMAAERDLRPGYVVLNGDRIERVAGGAVPAAKDTVLDFPDGTLIPGLIDLQVNGGAGVDCQRCTLGAYDALGRYLAATGVTAYLPTIITAPLEEMRAAIDVAASAMTRRAPGPSILGVHMEGPYLEPDTAGGTSRPRSEAPRYRGNRRDGAQITRRPRMVTLAPELEGAEEMTRWLVARHILVSIGHTDAAYDDVRAAAVWGARMATHLCNGMRGMHHREPGAVGGRC